MQSIAIINGLRTLEPLAGPDGGCTFASFEVDKGEGPSRDGMVCLEPILGTFNGISV